MEEPRLKAKSADLIGDSIYWQVRPRSGGDHY